ncbi:hypothetical protein EGR_05838 [Echinococcus granulosus]|uniref:Uncharacterized protein n=1 Tax=Echinococcus granulosus TaxID=6210 RepID=W6V061_ECHGR|nr:hypothetical protein EGR_05838 [Echinococcus granulosus]EUB59354.1 hypothetical protein EGR_05838 [Echinococcus granulosus]
MSQQHCCFPPIISGGSVEIVKMEITTEKFLYKEPFRFPMEMNGQRACIHNDHRQSSKQVKHRHRNVLPGGHSLCMNPNARLSLNTATGHKERSPHNKKYSAFYFNVRDLRSTIVLLLNFILSGVFGVGQKRLLICYKFLFQCFKSKKYGSEVCALCDCQIKKTALLTCFK